MTTATPERPSRRGLERVLRTLLMCGVGGVAATIASSGGALALDDRPGDLSDSSGGECQTLKLRAAGEYYACLLRAGDEGHGSKRCDHRFAALFERADRREPGCLPLDDLERSQQGIRNQAQEVLVGDISQPPCQGIVSGSEGLVTCQLRVPGENIVNSVANLADVLTQIQNEPDCPACAKVTDETPIWIQAWGGRGGDGDDSSEGAPGFAQLVTSISGLKSVGIVQFYFYLGAGGSNGGTTGGAGGAATLVTEGDLLDSPSTAPTDALLIAGGGGGGGGRNTGCIAGSRTPGTGGAGGLAISVTGKDGQRFGQGGQGGASGGGGGGQSEGGSGGGGGGGGDGIGGMGGGGGDAPGGGAPGSSGWYNTGATKLTFTSGEGGGGGGDKNSCTAGGGGGGGGYGGGGGGGDGDANRQARAGGGGGSYASASTCADPKAPTTFQNPPSTDGNVYLVFNTSATCS